MINKVFPKNPDQDAEDSPAVPDKAAGFQAQLIPLLLASRQGYALFDEQDKLQFANPAFRKALGLGRDELPKWEALVRQAYRQAIGMDIAVAEQDFEAWLQATQLQRGKMPYRSYETRLKDGRWALFTETTQANGWLLCVLTDVSSLGDDWRSFKQEREAALRAALRDLSTGLNNQRYAMSWLDSRLSTTKATSLSAIALDIDRFKRLNDTYGHDKGDKVLRHLATHIQNLARPHELTARMDSAQLLLVLEDLPPHTVEQHIAQLLQTVAQALPLHERPDLRYTCSAGLALALPGEMPRSLLNRADQALRQAKGQGGNRYILAE